MSNKEKILSVATDLFIQYGYEKTTIEDISKRIGKAKTSVYYYFGSKADLLRESLKSEFDLIREVLEEVRKQPYESVAAQFRDYLKRRMDLFIGSKVYKKMYFTQFTEYGTETSDIILSVRSAFDEWERLYFHDLCELGLQSGIFKPDVVPDAFSEMLLMLLKGVETQFFRSTDLEAGRSTYKEMIDFIIRDENQ